MTKKKRRTVSNMNQYYISFGQVHAHSVAGRTYDKDCIAVIKAKSKDRAHDLAMEIFGPKWSMLYEKEPDMSYFPRGLMELQ